LRYLIEPLADEIPVAAPLVKRFKELQDLLGDLHDAHVLEEELSDALAAAAAERAERVLAESLAEPLDPRRLRIARRRTVEPGLLTLAKANRERRDRLFAELQAGWLGGRADAFLEEVRDLEVKLAEETAAQYAPPSV
jgi:CHAD domain-containing protein